MKATVIGCRTLSWNHRPGFKARYPPILPESEMPVVLAAPRLGQASLPHWLLQEMEAFGEMGAFGAPALSLVSTTVGGSHLHSNTSVTPPQTSRDFRESFTDRFPVSLRVSRHQVRREGKVDKPPGLKSPAWELAKSSFS